MAFTVGEFVAPPGLTLGRLEWLAFALTKYGVSQAGAEQFTRGQPVTDAADRKALLAFVNRVVVEGSPGAPRFHGKGSH